MLKAIETVYNGYRFRSRLEARWAVFFDVLGIKYEYEKEGYDLDGIWYLPDFWLPEYNCWFEVKGQYPTKDEYLKAKYLAQASEKEVYIAIGEIKIPKMMEPEDDPLTLTTNIQVYGFPLEGEDFPYPNWPANYWCECPICKKIELLSGYTIGASPCSCLKNLIKRAEITHEDFIKSLTNTPIYNKPCIIAAYTSARQARFEHQ